MKKGLSDDEIALCNMLFNMPPIFELSLRDGIFL